MPLAPRRGPYPLSADRLAWIILVPVLAGASVLSALLLPSPLVLPALCMVMVLSGLTLAAGLYLAGYRMEEGPVGAWSAAGALVFLGFAAGILTDGEEALAALGGLETELRALAAR